MKFLILVLISVAGLSASANEFLYQQNTSVPAGMQEAIAKAVASHCSFKADWRIQEGSMTSETQGIYSIRYFIEATDNDGNDPHFIGMDVQAYQVEDGYAVSAINSKSCNPVR